MRQSEGEQINATSFGEVMGRAEGRRRREKNELKVCWLQFSESNKQVYGVLTGYWSKS